MLLETIKHFCQYLDVGLHIRTAHKNAVYVTCHSSHPLQYSVRDLLEDNWRRCYYERESIINTEPSMHIHCQVRL